MLTSSASPSPSSPQATPRRRRAPFDRELIASSRAWGDTDDLGHPDLGPFHADAHGDLVTELCAGEVACRLRVMEEEACVERPGRPVETDPVVGDDDAVRELRFEGPRGQMEVIRRAQAGGLLWFLPTLGSDKETATVVPELCPSRTTTPPSNYSTAHRRS